MQIAAEPAGWITWKIVAADHASGPAIIGIKHRNTGDDENDHSRAI
jgi:hypothetical protein